MNIETELESFDATVAFLHDHAGDPEALKDKTIEIVSAIEWGLFDGPELVDRRYLAQVSAGVRKLIGTLGAVAAHAEEDSAQEYAYALYKICDWRAQSTDIVRSWLGGWWTQNDGDESFGDTILAGLSDGLRLLQFNAWWLWRFYLAPRSWRFRRQCRTVEIVAPPPQTEEFIPPSPPPFVPTADEQRQQPCSHLDELAALLGVQFGSACAEEVVRAYQTRLEYADWDADTRWDLARCYARQGDYAQAIKAYDGVLQAQPEFHDARKELIFCLAALKQWDRSETEARYLKGFKRMREEARLALECLQTFRYQNQE